MEYKTYIFDLDGTLLDTLDDLTDAVNAALSAYDCPCRTREEVRGFVGNGIRLLMQRAVQGGETHPKFSEIFSMFRAYYKAHCKEKTRPYEGIEELLRRIKQGGGKAAIVSNKADFAVKELAKSYFNGLVETAIGENEEAGIQKKPAPDSVFAALKALGADTEGAVYIGDSEVDIETAKNAGLPCISVTWGFKDRAFLVRHGAVRLADTPSEIV